MAGSEHILIDTSEMTLRQVGGKFFRQKQLADMGFSVPRFFCLSTGFFDDIYIPVKNRVLAEIHAIDFGDRQHVKQAAENIQGIFSAIHFTDNQKEKILRTFDHCIGLGKRVAVRSCVVADLLHESEDSDDHSFAGMSETFLFVEKDAVLDTLLRCWASGFSAECLMYRHLENMNLSAVKVAVGIQEMVDGRRSFVLFTCNPASGARDAVITAGFGIGEGVVQERVPLDHYFVGFRNNEIASKIATKDAALVPDKQNPSALVIEQVPAESRNQAVLSDREISGLVNAGRKIERFYGRPQDIEGTFNESGELFFLQSRPVNLNLKVKKTWTDANISESFSGVTTVLTYSFACFFYRRIFYDQHRRKGIPPNILHDNDAAFSHMLGYIDGRILYSVDTFYRLLSMDPLFSSTDWENMIGLGTSYITETYGIEERHPHGLMHMFKLGRAYARAAISGLRLPGAFKHFFKWWSGLMDKRRAPAYFAQDPLVLIDDFRKVWRDVGNYWGITLLNDGYLSYFTGLVNRLFEKTRIEPGLINNLFCGGEQPLSSKIVLSCISLAEMVRRNNDLKTLFSTLDEKTLWHKLDNGELDSSFSSAVKHHLNAYGDRGIQELKMEHPGLRQTPWILPALIRQYIDLDISVADITERDNKLRMDAEKSLLKALWHHPVRLVFIRQTVKKLRSHIRYREASRYCRSELFSYSRNIFYRLGEELFEKGYLEEKDDFLHLTMEELFGAFNGTGVTRDLKSLAALRRKEYASWSAAPRQGTGKVLEFTTHGMAGGPTDTSDPCEEKNTSVLQGIGSSSGRVTGTARVIFSPDPDCSLGKNDILIARETDPGWLFLMVCAGGLVVERGSMLSHSAIIGRKLGIPTIVAVENATRYITEGAEIEIDGSSGVVRLL